MSNNKFKILVIEDETNICSFLETLLIANGYQTMTAKNCVTGNSLFMSYNPDLVILDLGLPDKDGIEFIKSIRKTFTTPIIVLSARTSETDKVTALDFGANDYMTKPFSPSELVARVKAHLARYDRLTGSAVEKNKIIEIRGLRIDTTARRVWVNDVEKTFTTKEFDLLTFLASHPNHVYTKEELFREIWDMESIGDIATVTVHIKKIREKVEVDTSNPQ